MKGDRPCIEVRRPTLQVSNSGLVTQTLLVTILAHALAALMLVNFGFTSLLQGSHNA